MQLSITEYMRRWVAAVLCGAALTFTMPTAAPAQEQLPSGYRAYRLRHREADDLAPQLRKMLSGLKGDSQVLVDQEANRLVVRGDDQAQQLAAQLVGALDQPSRSSTTSSPATAERPASADAATIVRAYATPDQDLQAVADSLRKHFAAARIEADPRTGQIIVAAPESIQRQIAEALDVAESELATVDRNAASTPPASEFRPTHQLRHVSWREFEDQLRTLWGTQLGLSTSRNGELATVSLITETGSQPVLHIDRRLDLVTFDSVTESSRIWRQIVRTLDSVPQANYETALIRLEKADPQQVRQAVSLIQTTQSLDGNQVVAAVPLHRGDRSRRSNALVSMLFQPNGQALDAQAPPAADNAQPAQPGAAQPATEPQATEAVQLGTEPAGAAGAGLIGPVQIEFIEGTDTIIIKGHEDDVARVRKMIEDIERIATTTKPVIEVYPLLHINSEAAATIAEEVYTEILSSRQGAVSIRALVEPNSILLIGREESVNDVKGLLAKLDQPTDAATGFEVFRLKHMSASTAETAVRNFFVDQPTATGTGGGTPGDNLRPGLGTRARVIADIRTNSLLVQASPRDLGEVRRLIESLDVVEGEHTSQVRVFKLKNTMAEELATVLQGAISGQTQAAGGQGQGFQQQGQQQGGNQGTTGQASGALEFMMIDQDGGKLLRSGILADVLVTGDANTNSLIVTAPAKSMELIAALIEQLDQLPDAEAQIKVFTIVNGDATSLAAMLQQLFGQQVTAGQGNTGALFGGLNFNQNQLQTTTGAGGESSLIPLRFAIDTRTNSIIASGSENDLTVVETLLLRLDEGDIDQRKLVVVRLKNAPAQDVANSITSLLTTQRSVIQQQLLTNQAISAYEQIDREVIVVPEIVTNSLIVSATSRYFDEVMKVIQELDFRPPMVMVQVVIAEVGLNNTFELGTEFGLQDSLLYDRGIAGTASDPGFNFNDANVAGVGFPGLPNRSNAGRGTIANQALSNFLVGRSSGLGFGGLVLSGASDSFNYLLRALEVEGKAQILSRPQIMTLNNQPAFVQVGADVPRIQGATNTNAGVTNDIEDTPTGLILRIQPLINDDGVIVMTLDAERSFLDTGAVPVDLGNGAEAFPIRRTTAQTTVSAKSGQTVVFAGLITTERTVQVRKIPYVSDIPVLGHLFQYKQDFEERRELLIVMTPFIVRDDEDYEMIKMMESERMSWCLGNVVAIHGEVGLVGGSCMFCDTDVPTLFPDDNPTGLEPLPHAEPQLVQQEADSRMQSTQEAGSWQRQPVPQAAVPLQPVQTSSNTGNYPPPVIYGPAPAPTTQIPRMVQPAEYRNVPGARAQPIPNRLPATP